jgi:Ca2+-binding EF-hand superfamily protein
LGRWSAVLRPALASPNLRSNGQFLVAQLRSAIGSETSLARAHIDDDPLLGALRPLFPYADRNNDGRLGTQELEDYLQLVELAVASQVRITVHDASENLFVALDADEDGRLSYREIAQAGRALPAGEPIMPRRQFRFSFGHVEARTWGGVAIPAVKRSPRSQAPIASAPRWFGSQDTNRDGIVSPREFLGPPEAFRRLDKDADGVIDAAEADGPKP